ncbi:Zn-dependent exopeptidase [Fistulina hepatica ATCC 64428]|nr:Zn-dependent exopeptidase [Fistulina hepatica ATCC 64428]
MCVQPYPPAARSNYSNAYDDEAFVVASAERLAGAVRIPTMSFDQMGPPGVDPRWEVFSDLHKYLEETFPLVHKTMDLVKVGGYSLIYTWKGSNPSLKPAMLTAHQDVVPAVTVLDRWQYPPFEGVVKDGWVHGRGSSDCKNNLIGLLTSAEHLISEGWTPERTIVYAFGQDEEASGAYGAKQISSYLESVHGKHGVAFVLDEGGMGIETTYGTDFALPGVAEKGHADLHIQVDTLGGHSSTPTDHTSVGYLSKIVSAIEDAPLFHPHLELVSPLWGYLQCVGTHAPSAPKWIKDTISARHPDLRRAALDLSEELGPKSKYLIQTSKAVTTFNGGTKARALCCKCWFGPCLDFFFFACSMILTVEETINAFMSAIMPVAEKYSLSVNGQTSSSGSVAGNVTVSTSLSLDPSPIAPLGSEAWSIFTKAVQAAFGPTVVTAPSAMTGNTDTRFYWNLSPNIYRWSPARIGTRLNAHTVDEKLKVSSHVDGIRFYTELIRACSLHSMPLLF